MTSRFYYDYDEDLLRTTAWCPGNDMTVVLRPSRRPNVAYEIGLFPNDDTDPIIAQFSAGGLNEFIAEVQRMRSGCFDQDWPRPSRGVEDIEPDDLTFADLLGDPLPAPRQGPIETIADLLAHLEENYSANDRLRNVSVNADECLIRINASAG